LKKHESPFECGVKVDFYHQHSLYRLGVYLQYHHIFSGDFQIESEAELGAAVEGEKRTADTRYKLSDP